MLKRFQLFEFGDQPWLSGWVREAYLDCLSQVHRNNRPYYNVAAPLAEWAKPAKGGKVLDMGSGGGEHIAVILQTCKELGIPPPHFVLSDLYPDITDYVTLQKECGDSAVSYMEKPVSALDVPNLDINYWSICTAFHHFSPESARQLLQQFVLKADGLCILEIQQRTISRVLSMIGALPTYFIAPFGAKNFQFRKMLVTTFIPIVPLMMTFDGIVSALRSYTKEEILALMPPGSDKLFFVEYKEVKWPSLPFKSSMLSFTRK